MREIRVTVVQTCTLPMYHRRVPKGFKLQNRIVVGLAFVVLWCGQAAAQTLSGVVTDERGAPVVGAAVTAREEGTSSAARGTTDGEGRFVLSPAPARAFALAVEAEGFGRFERVLKAGEFVRVVLAPAGLKERVTVT